MATIFRLFRCILEQSFWNGYMNFVTPNTLSSWNTFTHKIGCVIWSLFITQKSHNYWPNKQCYFIKYSQWLIQTKLERDWDQNWEQHYAKLFTLNGNGNRTLWGYCTWRPGKVQKWLGKPLILVAVLIPLSFLVQCERFSIISYRSFCPVPFKLRRNKP